MISDSRSKPVGEVRTRHDDEVESWLERLGAAAFVCDESGLILASNAEARALSSEIGFEPRHPAPSVPREIWRDASSMERGTLFDWPNTGGAPLRASVLALGREWLVLTAPRVKKATESADRLHRQRLEMNRHIIASIAHDMRNAAARVIRHLDAFSESRAGSQSPSDTLRELQAGSEHLRVLIDDLLDFLKLGSHVAVHPSVEDLFARSASLVRSLYRDGNHSVHFSIEPGAEFVRASPVLVEQILVNLLVNAAEAGEGARTVRVSAALNPDRSMVRIRVEDDGPGIPEHLRSLIFHPFFSTKQLGSGLGLSTSREAASTLHGTLDVVPSARGATFELSVPSAKAANHGDRS